MVVLGDHFFERQFRFLRMSSGGKIIGMVDSVNDQFFFHANRENGVAFFEFLVPTIIRVSIREY